MRCIGMFWLRATLAVGALALFPSVSQAGLMVDDNRYCSKGPNVSTTSDTVPGSNLALNDVTLTIAGSPQYKASDCYGDFDTDNHNPDTETGAVNDVFAPGLAAPKFSFLDKDENAGPDNSEGLGGIVFEVLASGGENDGTWTISWEDTNGTEPENLPLLVDLVVMLKGSNNAAIYLLSNVLLSLDPTSGLGTFDIQFLNNGGKSCETASLKKKDPGDSGPDGKECKDNQPGLSHLTLLGRVVQSETFQVPEPASLGMFGAGLLGLWMFRRKGLLPADGRGR